MSKQNNRAWMHQGFCISNKTTTAETEYNRAVKAVMTLWSFKSELTAPTKILGFPHSSVGEESTCNAGDPGSILGLEKSPGAGNGNPLQYPCLENPMDRGAWWATVYGVTRVRHDWETHTPKILSLHTLWPSRKLLKSFHKLIRKNNELGQGYE